MMSGKDERQPTVASTNPARGRNAPMRSNAAPPPLTSTARSSDTSPVVDHFARVQRFNLSQGLVELAENLTDRIAPIMRRQPGFRSLTLLSDDTSGEYILLTHWASLEEIQTFERTADEWRVRDIISEHITAVPQIEVYQVHNIPQAITEPDGG